MICQYILLSILFAYINLQIKNFINFMYMFKNINFLLDEIRAMPILIIIIIYCIYV